jgi:hypothetical protein
MNVLEKLFILIVNRETQETKALLDVHGPTILHERFDNDKAVIFDSTVIHNDDDEDDDEEMDYGGVLPSSLMRVYRGDLAIHLAAKVGDPELFTLLWKRGADIRSVDMDEETVFHIAANHGHVKVGEFLLSKGSRVDEKWRDKEPLLMAAINGKTEFVSFLLENGANVHATTAIPDTCTALHFAALYEFIEVCEVLLSKGADLYAVSGHGHTPIDCYRRGCTWDSLDDVVVSEAEMQSNIARLEAAWRAGPHPSQVQRRQDEAWARRWPFVQVLVCHDFQPLVDRKRVLKMLYPALPHNVSVPALQGARSVLIRDKVLSHPGFWRLIAVFL